MLAFETMLKPFRSWSKWLPALATLAWMSLGQFTSLLACASCDRPVFRHLLGWSPDGKAALVRAESPAGDRYLMLETWSLGAPLPKECFNLLDDPELVIPCDPRPTNGSGTAKE